MHCPGVALRLITLLVLCLLPLSAAQADLQQGWLALEQLRIEEARELLEEVLKEEPDNQAAKRGLLLVAYFDMDLELQMSLINQMVEDDPSDGHLLGLYEHLAAVLPGYKGEVELREKLGEGFLKQPPGGLRYVGRLYDQAHARLVLEDVGRDFVDRGGFIRGCWLAGPFENESRIAAFRKLPFETKPLDTSAVIAGKNGSRAQWTWLDADRYGEVYPRFALENSGEMAIECRSFFELPAEQDVIISLAGAFHYRLHLDGEEVYEDRIYRNSFQREAFRVHLNEGAHELALIMGSTSQLSDFRLALLDTLYQPIEGLKWSRTPIDEYQPTPPVTVFHPIFDVFQEYLDRHGKSPDSDYWGHILKIYNGFYREVAAELEEKRDADGISNLEMWTLHTALELNDETARSAAVLTELSSACETPLTEFAMINLEEDFNARIRQASNLATRFPNRPEIDALVALSPALNGDLPGLVASGEEYEKKHPGYAKANLTMAAILGRALGDAESSLEQFERYAKKTNRRLEEVLAAPRFYLAAGKYEESLKAAKKAIELMPQLDEAVELLVSAYSTLGNAKEAEPVVSELLKRVPGNIELWSWMHFIHNEAGQHDKANDVLKKIHLYKPSASRPYHFIDSLHNSVPYDSIFGYVDPSELWDVEPSEAERGGEGSYTLMDRNQAILFESGVVCRDMHWAIVLTDRSEVESSQQYYVGFSESEDYADLLVARRLRKGAPPLAGTHQGDYVVFQDLQPGDAVEIRIRTWTGNSGDLWREFWDDYSVGADVYQRYWEYAVLTNRDDLNYASVGPCPEPVVDEYCGFKRIAWKGEDVDFIDLDPILLPPYPDIAGRIYVSTLPAWEAINRWYCSISESVLDDNPRTLQLTDSIAATVSAAAAGETTLPEVSDREKLRSFYEQIVLDIPYQTLGFDYDGAIPHTPDEVLINRWGDCKDKSHLLIFMLRHEGIDAWPVLVMMRDNGTSIPLPYFGFDHLIVAAEVDGDTVYVDPSGVAYPPFYSINEEVAGQPCLHINCDKEAVLDSIPEFDAEDHLWTWEFRLTPAENGEYRYDMKREYMKLATGYRRDAYRDQPYQELVKERESFYADEWGVSLEVDTIQIDSVNTVDEVYRDRWSGTITIPIQELGKTTVVTLPPWSQFERGLSSRLTGYGKRTQPVDLRYYAGVSRQTLVFTVPDGYTRPQAAEAVNYSDSLLSFVYDSSWDPESRELTLDYEVTIRDGYVPVDLFEQYVETILDVFESPLLLMKE